MLWNSKSFLSAVCALSVGMVSLPSQAELPSTRGIDNGKVIVNQEYVRANGGIIRVTEDAFTASAGLITFSEFPTGTQNPSYNPGDYGGAAGDPVVTFEGWFAGQSLAGAACPPGAASTGCIAGVPTNPLTLDPSAPDTSIVGDGANPTSPVLSGSPIFNGPVAIHFDTDQAGVGLDGGFFDAAGGTAITAFARDGSEIGTVVNEELGIEFLGLVTADGQEKIAGLLFHLVGEEPAGFAIDNVRFGEAGDIVSPAPPAPAGPPKPVPTMSAWGLIFMSGLLAVIALVRSNRKS